MPGIFGCFSPKPNQKKIMSLAKTLEYTISEVKASDVSLICKLDIKTLDAKETGIQHEKGGYIIFSGEIYNETIKDPKKYFVDLYKTGDFEKLKEVNGSFFVAIYDDKNEKLTLINDRFGSLKHFYCYEKNQLFFSPKISALMSIVENKKIQKDALIDFLIFGFCLGNKTFDENIFQFPPGSILEITKQKMTLKRYWTYPCDGKYDERDENTLLEELGRRWQNAVDRRIKKDEKSIIQISGGLDSRAILAAALKSTDKEHIFLYTFGEKGSYDFDIGTRIAETLGIHHASLHPLKEHFAEQYTTSFVDSEGMIDATPYFPVQMDKFLEHVSTKVYNGYMGGEMMGPLIFSKIKNLQLHTEDQYEKAKEILLNHHRINEVDTVRQMLHPLYLKGEPILSSFDASVRDLKGVSTEEFPNYCARWLYFNESDKYTLFCNFRYRNIFNYSTPFLDNDIVDFMSKVPPELRTDKHLYKTMVQKTYPELFRLPTKNMYGLPLQTNHIVFFIKVVLGFVQRKTNTFLNRLGKPNFFFNKNENYLNYDDLLRTNTEYQQYVKSMIDKAKKREFFNPEYIDALWVQHMKGKKNYSKLFGLIVTFEMILEKYYD
jgi:asparagine synthase (glutamine-hydrolysing)